LIRNGRNPDDEAADRASRGQATVNILIVDDDPRNLMVLEAILDDPSYRLVRAGSAEEALRALLHDEFALLILDIHMPGMTGFKLAEMIRERKKTANVPIIFLTAQYRNHEHVIKGYDAGAVDYLEKPVDPAVLRSKVAVFSELYRKQRDVEHANQALRAEVEARRRAEEQLRESNDKLEQRTASLDASNQHIMRLLREVDHRSKNLLCIVQAIARQTAVGNPEFIKHFLERIGNLAATHDLLFKHRWQGVEVSDLVHLQLAHFGHALESRIHIDGPPFRLSVAAAQTLGIIIHELATNAAKYGALSNDCGHVDIRWGANGEFTMGWSEHDGPKVDQPCRRGFGSTVVKSMAESSLGGEVDLDFSRTGLRWRLVCPSLKVLEKSVHRT
jgi:two-component sensor histidine kinase/CheY-like chemotaxis protein